MRPNDKTEGDLPDRCSTRLSRYDYCEAGGYFVTVCVEGRRMLFGEVVDGKMIANATGVMVDRLWHKLPERFAGLILDEFVLMPNHVHGVLIIPWGGARATSDAGPAALGQVVGAFKSITMREYFRGQKRRMGRLWQRNYHDHVIRGDADLERIRKYIRENPLKWSLDRENPAAQGPDEGEEWGF